MVVLQSTLHLPYILHLHEQACMHISDVLDVLPILCTK